MDKHNHERDNETDREKEVIDADDTGMLEGERRLNQVEIDQALNGKPPPSA
jgi:hypothetical protein